MGSKNSFRKMCDKLEAEYVFNENEIEYVKKYIEREIGKDMNMLLKIKAEAQESDYIAFASFKIASVAMLFSRVGVAS